MHVLDPSATLPVAYWDALDLPLLVKAPGAGQDRTCPSSASDGSQPHRLWVRVASPTSPPGYL